MVLVRSPESIYRITGTIQDGTFEGRWHFSFGNYSDRTYLRFGALRVLNDDTLSPGAIWPLHPHHDIEVVTYCAAGEFRHADEKGFGGVLKKGHVQHTTVGSGMWHSEINNRSDIPMRFIQMWFFPLRENLEPSVEQKAVEKEERTNRLLPLVSPVHKDTLNIHSDAIVYSSFLEAGRSVIYAVEAGRGAYIYPLEGGPIEVDGKKTEALGAVMVKEKRSVEIKAAADTELIVVDVVLIGGE